MLTMFGNRLFITRRVRGTSFDTGKMRFRKLMLSAAAAPFMMLTSLSVAHANDLDILLQAEDAAVAAPQKISHTKPAPTNSGISISVDGETVLGNPTPEDTIIRTDRDLEAVDIQIKFDGLDVTRRLNVATPELRNSYKPGEVIAFRGSWNYPDWIDRAEIHIYRSIDKPNAQTVAHPVEIIAMPTRGENSGKVEWKSFSDVSDPSLNGGDFSYVLRVYDDKGRFDETLPLHLVISEEEPLYIDKNLGKEPAVAVGEADDRTGVSNIPLYGGSVTVYGRHVPPGYTVEVLGQEIPVDNGQRFVTSRILPPGDHAVDVSVSGLGKDSGLQFERDINIPDSEWFYVGLADITLGKRLGEDAQMLVDVHPNEFSDTTFRRGRLAFYVKGKIKGSTLLTAAFDTTEEELDEIFDNLDRKDPRRLLRNLDPDDFYPVFGDDSTTVDDAPTSGKFYVRLEKGKSHVLWGDFKTRIDGTELARYERGLYGAKVHLESDYVTSHGQPVAELEAFGAEPGTLPQRDELRGTGGSAYFLRRQDINRGSEQITIERRDRVTGEVVERTVLRADEDYQIDYIQGVVLLRRPLQSQGGTTSAVRQGVTGDQEIFLVAVYEYTPTLTDLDGYTYGGRGQVWITDNLRIGATGYLEDTGFADQRLYGLDAHLRISPKSYFELEWAQSEGSTFGVVTSTDGGFIFNPVSGAGPANGTADAYRAKLSLDLGELSDGQLEGTVGGYYESREAGFNAPGRYTTVDERLSGVFADIKLDEDTTLRAKYDEVNRADGDNRREISAEVERRFNDEYTGSIGITHSDFASRVGTGTGFGERTDVGARLTRTLDEKNKAWIFGQATVSRDKTRERNDRVGIGFERQITDRLSAEAEVSYGTLGFGGLAGLVYTPNADDKYYVGYRIDPDTTAGDLNGYDPFGRDLGSIVYGANRKINDKVSAFFEENYDFSGTQRSLTHTYGVTYTPDAVWTVNAGFEAGEIFDEVNGDFDRIAVSTGVSLRDEVKNASLRFEARFEEGQNAAIRDRNTYLLSGQYGHLHNDDWRFIASIDAVLSESDQDTILDGDYIEGSIGWAYRPVDSDRLNALFRYTYLEDLPGAQQVNAQNQLLGPRQRSHVLEADFVYQVNERLSVGGKYGFRTGQVETSRGTGNFQDSSAHLAIARVDYHVIDKWDLLLEARALWLPELEQTNTGILAGAYYHLGDNLKLGVGYNFGQFSDDLTDLTYDDEGVFINVIGKF